MIYKTHHQGALSCHRIEHFEILLRFCDVNAIDIECKFGAIDAIGNLFSWPVDINAIHNYILNSSSSIMKVISSREELIRTVLNLHEAHSIILLNNIF